VVVSREAGGWSPGMGVPMNKRRQERAIQRAHCAARSGRALALSKPELAYICR
jgi:hypothetical protein